MAESTEVTALLQAWSGGDEAALDQLTPLIYKELRRLAGSFMRREREGHTLQPTALANEAYMRLAEVQAMNWRDRAHFFAVASRVMRRILVDSARAKGAHKRGDGAKPLRFDEMPDVADGSADDRQLTALDDALEALARVDPRKVQVIEMRFFGGLTVEETAEVLKISPQSVLRDWKLARAWLNREMRGPVSASGAG